MMIWLRIEETMHGWMCQQPVVENIEPVYLKKEKKKSQNRPSI
jgi:hypothetical protein